MYLLIKVFLWCLFAKFSVRFMELVIKFCLGDIARSKVNFFPQKCGVALQIPRNLIPARGLKTKLNLTRVRASWEQLRVSVCKQEQRECGYCKHKNIPNR
jgi:hypothetical protein